MQNKIVSQGALPTLTKLQKYRNECNTRIVYILVAFVFAWVSCYVNATPFIFLFLIQYLNACELFQLTESEKNLGEHFSHFESLADSLAHQFILTQPQEGFSSAILVTNLFSFFFLVPFSIYMLLAFLVPSWHVSQARRRVISASFIYIFWVVWLFSIEFSIIPQLASFFLQFQSKNETLQLRVEPKIEQYLSWVTNVLILSTLFWIAVCVMVCFFLFQKRKFISKVSCMPTATHSNSNITVQMEQVGRKKQVNALFPLPLRARKRFPILKFRSASWYWGILFVSAFIAPPDLMLQLGMTTILIFVFELFLLSFFLSQQFFALFYENL